MIFCKVRRGLFNSLFLIFLLPLVACIRYVDDGDHEPRPPMPGADTASPTLTVPAEPQRTADAAAPVHAVATEVAGWSVWTEPEAGANSLHLTGSVTTPTPGYEVELKKEDVQHVPNTLVLYVESRPLDGYWAQVLTTKSVSFTDPDFDGEYENIVIYLPDDRIVRLKLERVAGAA